LKHAAPASEAGPITVTWHKVVTCVLITRVGFNLRSVILGVPPVLPLIQHGLELSYTATGFLTAWPVLSIGITLIQTAVPVLIPHVAVFLSLLLMSHYDTVHALSQTTVGLYYTTS
jgi:MFS transporter, CP family, cyanate transporter